MILSSSVSDFMDAKATMSKDGKKSYFSTLRRFDNYCYKYYDLETQNADTKHVAGYLLQFENNAYETRISYKKILKSYFAWLLKRGIVKFNPVDDIIIKGNARKEQKKFLNEEDFRDILKNCETLSERAMVYFLFYTGVRPKELINMKIDDVDLRQRTIWVGVSKSSNGNRLLPIASPLFPMLAKYIERRKKVTAKDNNQFLFVNKHRNPMAYRTLLYYIEKASDFTPYDFRRSCGTRLYRKTKDIVLVHNFMGHSSIEITRKHYILDDQESMNAVKELDF